MADSIFIEGSSWREAAHEESRLRRDPASYRRNTITNADVERLMSRKPADRPSLSAEVRAAAKARANQTTN